MAVTPSPTTSSVWTPGENHGKSIEFSSTCWLIQRGTEWLLWDTGVPESALNDPKGWSTLPKLIVYHLDRTLTDQLAAIGLKTTDITYVALSHTHGDHIGNVRLFPNSTVLMQRAEYAWISSPDGPNDNVNQLKALARKLLGIPKHLRLLDGDTDVFGDGSVTLVSTPGHTPGSQSLLAHLKNSGFIVLSGDVVHLEKNFEKDAVPSLNTDRPRQSPPWRGSGGSSQHTKRSCLSIMTRRSPTHSSCSPHSTTDVSLRRRQRAPGRHGGKL